MNKCLIPLLVAIAGTSTLAGASTSVASSPSPSPPTCPPPAPAPAAATRLERAAEVRAPATALVACVGAMPITGRTFDHWAVIAERAEGHRRPKPHALVVAVMGFLISSDWTLGEATALGVTLTAGQVRHSFEKLRRQQFPHRHEFARFLRSSGETVADLLFRVRVNMLSQAIQRKALSAGHSEAEKARLLAEFISGFKARWQPQTYCATRFAVPSCGHVGTL
jgi:hypothetical protein